MGGFPNRKRRRGGRKGVQIFDRFCVFLQTSLLTFFRRSGRPCGPVFLSALVCERDQVAVSRGFNLRAR
eukprot:1027687-Amphidinium_carterae.1